MKTKIAPIGLSTYARLGHLQETVTALKKNILADQSELYVFSDAPKQGDEQRVDAVRAYLRSVDGFKAVHIFEREINDRVANSRGGMKMLLEQFGKVIFLAEDIKTAPGFLTFLNEALLKYESNESVFNVSGYCPPIPIPDDYGEDVFFLRRLNAWGFGIWKDRFDQLAYMSPEAYESFRANETKVGELERSAGKDLMHMLKRDAYGEIDAGDVKLMFAQFLSNQYTVYPTRSLTINMGHDGSGTHCGTTAKFDVELSDKKSFHFPDEIVIEPRIVHENYLFRSDPSRVENRKTDVRDKLVWLFRKIYNYLKGIAPERVPSKVDK